MRIRNAAVAGVFALSYVASTPTMAQGYSFMDLGTLGGTWSVASDINNAGQIVGTSQIASGGDRATLWQGTTITDLGTLGRGSGATSINNVGQVAGYSNGRTTKWTLSDGGATITDLGLYGGHQSYATGINDAGQIVVQVYSGDNALAVRSTGATVSSTGLLWATGINSAGQVVGTASTGYTGHASLWTNNSPSDLGVLPFTVGNGSSAANSINDVGQIVGWSDTAGNKSMHAALWSLQDSGVTITDLDALRGAGTYSSANDVNNLGQVVGSADTGVGATRHATLWTGGAMVDLNTFLDASTIASGWVLTFANAINDNGWIVGSAQNTLTGQQHAFLLTSIAPVPEPETYAMMLAGLGLLGLIRRRSSRECLNSRRSERWTLRRLAYAIFCLGTAFSGAARAEIITNPVSIVRHGAFITDTANNLDWLRLDDSRVLGKSYNEVMANAALLAEGWGYATLTQLHNFESQFGWLSDTTSPGANQNSGLERAIRAYLGGTVSKGSGEQITAITFESVAYGVHTTARLEHRILDLEQPSPSDWNDFVSGSFTSRADSLAADRSISSFLVRESVAPIPEPETYAMMLAGLGLLGVIARRRKQKET